MEKPTLKSAFFGYSKTSVCEYIARISEEFSKKLMELNADHKKEREELNARIATLEQELAEYRRAHANISATLLEAQEHAEELKTQAEAENQRLRAENAERNAAQQKRMEAYKAEVNELRIGLSLFAEETDLKLQTHLNKMEEIRSKYAPEEEGEEDL